MSQLLIVQSSKREPANQLFTKGLTLFNSLCKLRPCSSIASATLAVAVFPEPKLSPARLFGRKPQADGSVELALGFTKASPVRKACANCWTTNCDFRLVIQMRVFRISTANSS